MKAFALIGTAVASLFAGAVAAGWLVMLTPAPAHPLRDAAPYDVGAASAAAEAQPAAPSAAPLLAPAVHRRLATPMASESDFAPTPQPAASPAPPTAPAPAKAAPAKTAPVKTAPVKAASARADLAAAPGHRYARVTALVALHGTPGAAPQASIDAVARASLRPERHAERHAEQHAEQHAAHRAAVHVAGLLTPAEVGRIRASLRLSPEQEGQWAPVGEMLRRVGRQQMAAAKNGEEFNFASSGDLMGFYAVAAPLLRGLREDQKGEVRALARRMGFGSYAAYI